MSTTIALVSAESFRVQRVSKSGKIATRDITGIMLSGTPKERLEYAIERIDAQWQNGTFDSAVENMYRVFGAKTVNMLVEQANGRIAGRNELLPADQQEPQISLLNRPTKRSLLFVIQALILSSPTLKGEKAKLVEVFRNIAEREVAREKANKAKADAAAQAAIENAKSATSVAA